MIPHAEQNTCLAVRVLNSYVVSQSSPERILNRDFGTIRCRYPDLLQIEQSQSRDLQPRWRSHLKADTSAVTAAGVGDHVGSSHVWAAFPLKIVAAGAARGLRSTAAIPSAQRHKAAGQIASSA